MGVIPFLGIVCGGFSLLFAAVAAMIYFKIKKLYSLIDESQYEQVEQIVEQQRRKIHISLLLSSIFTIATIVLSVVNSF